MWQVSALLVPGGELKILAVLGRSLALLQSSEAWAGPLLPKETCKIFP